MYWFQCCSGNEDGGGIDKWANDQAERAQLSLLSSFYLPHAEDAPLQQWSQELTTLLQHPALCNEGGILYRVYN